MSRSIEHIVEMHRVATERRQAGRPIWDHTIDVSPWWRNEGLTFEERRDGIVGAIKRSRWYKRGGESSNLYEVVDELAAVPDAGEFDEWWDQLYDLADCDRVWIDTVGRRS